MPKINYCSKSQNNSGISIRGDIVGPPNPISNIRPIIFHIPRNETTIEKIFRHKREHIQKWHEEFWSNHNLKFVQVKFRVWWNKSSKFSSQTLVCVKSSFCHSVNFFILGWVVYRRNFYLCCCYPFALLAFFFVPKHLSRCFWTFGDRCFLNRTLM